MMNMANEKKFEENQEVSSVSNDVNSLKMNNLQTKVVYNIDVSD